MTISIIFRKAASEDAAFIHQSLKDMAAEQNLEKRFALTNENLFDALFSEKSFAEAILALSNNQPIGLALFSKTNRNFDLFDGSGIYVHDIYIQKSYRRKKVGTQLAHQIQKIAQERKCSRLDWVVLKNNPGAIDFYKTISDAKEVDYINYMRINL